MKFQLEIEIDPTTSPDVKEWTPEVLSRIIERALEPIVDATVSEMAKGEKRGTAQVFYGSRD